MEFESIKVEVLDKNFQDSSNRTEKFLSRYVNTVRYISINDIVEQKTDNEVCKNLKF